MYLFKATYVNMDTNEERVKTIEVEAQFFDNEVEVYKSAMERAYNDISINETLSSVEFISC